MAKASADSHAPKHPYHLVNPSPWPMAISFALLFLTGGGVLAMHNVKHGGVVLFLGLISTLGVAYAWWRDVIREGIHDKAHNDTVKTGLRYGMLLFIVSEIMFFFAFFWAFFWASLKPLLPLEGVWPALKAGVWPPESITTLAAWDLPFINTLILLLSGTTVTWAHHALLKGRNDEVKTALLITVLLGLTFTGLQALEYSHATFAFKDGIYPSTFYMATGFHGFHVIVGTLFLAVCLIRSHRGTLTPKGHLGFEFAAWYWHFVDAVWLFLFVCVYWWGS